MDPCHRCRRMGFRVWTGNLVFYSDSNSLYKNRPEHTHRRITDSGVQVRIEWEVWHFLRMYARKCMPQRAFRRNRCKCCGARRNTTLVDETLYPVFLTELSLSNSISFLELFGVQCLDPPFITGFTKPMDSPNQTTTWITARSTKP